MQSLYGVQASEAARVWSRAGSEGCGRHAVHVHHDDEMGGGAKRGACSPGFWLSLALINPNINHEHQGARAAAMAAEHASPRMV